MLSCISQFDTLIQVEPQQDRNYPKGIIFLSSCEESMFAYTATIVNVSWEIYTQLLLHLDGVVTLIMYWSVEF